MTHPIIAPHRAQYAPALQRSFISGIDPSKVRGRALPASLTGGTLNILDRAAPVFAPWTLLSWGQFASSPATAPPGVVAKRDRSAGKLIADSGGFQFIGNPTLFKQGSTVFRYLGWAETHADVAMTMDIPTRAIGNGRWTGFQDCLDDTLVCLRDLEGARQSQSLVFLNVLQGRDWQECLAWYEAVKVHPFEGWAFGGASRDLRTMLRLVARMVRDGNVGRHLHVLGTSSLQRAAELSALKSALRNAGHEVEVTFDTATPSIMAANGLIFTGANLTGFASNQSRVPLDPALSGSSLPFPVSTTATGRVMVMGDVLARTRSAQSGLDSTGHTLLVHHNIEQLFRNIEEANRWADMSPNLTTLGPLGFKQRLHDIRSFLAHVAPEKAIAARLRGFVDGLEEDRVNDGG